MLATVLAILVILWLLGLVRIQGFSLPNIHLFTINRFPVRLFDVLILLVFIWLIDLLPSPFREVGSVLLILYVLSVLGVIALVGMSNIIILALIVATIVYLFQRPKPLT